MLFLNTFLPRALPKGGEFLLPILHPSTRSSVPRLRYLPAFEPSRAPSRPASSIICPSFEGGGEQSLRGSGSGTTTSRSSRREHRAFVSTMGAYANIGDAVTLLLIYSPCRLL